MSGKSPPTSKNHVSMFSRFKNRVSSTFVSSSSASPPNQRSGVTSDSTGRLNIPTHHADTDASSTLSRPSLSNTPVPSVTNSKTIHPLLSSSTAPETQASPLCRHPPPSEDDSTKLDAPSHYADTEPLSVPASHPPSVSNTAASPTTDGVPACPTPRTQHFTYRVEESNHHKYSSTQILSSTSPPLPRGQALTYQELNHAFDGAHDFVMNNPMFNDYSASTDNFMEKLLQETIIGAEFDSSARDPPPRCHPGTRLAIIQRCLDFIVQCQDEGKLRWVFGPAGVGKSAILQMVTENAPDGVIFTSIFFSVNGRRDGKKAIITIAYQLAVKCGPYRKFIRDQISLDPSLLRKSLSVQFNKFIVEPFLLQRIFEPSHRFLVVIDGLDECDSPPIQQVLLELISDFCIAHPTSPIAWLIASRPEPHISSFFDNPDVRLVYTKEEIVIDSDEACEDVQRYLREELKKIKIAHPTLRHKREWPLEHEFTKIAAAAGGLFAYAATVIRYIGDRTQGGPAAQFRRVLETIDATTKDPVAGADHPMDQLDALYKRILSNIPVNVMRNTRKLLIASSGVRFTSVGFREICNILELSEDDAYDAICHLHAVMKIPEPDKADDRISFYHKSFGDFLFDSKRSGFSDDIKSEAHHLRIDTAFRIVKEVHDDSDGAVGSDDFSVDSGGLVKGHCDSVSLSWPGDERFKMTDEEMRFELYQAAVRVVHSLFSLHCAFHESISCFHALTTRFTLSAISFPFQRLRDCAFDRFRGELMKLGKLKQIPLRAFDYAAVCGDIELQFTSTTGSNDKVSDTWIASCKHTKYKLWKLQDRQGWSTTFERYYRPDSPTEDNADANIPRFHVVTHQQSHEKWIGFFRSPDHASLDCIHCSQRFARHFINNRDIPATVFVDQTQMCYVEFSFVDPDDGASEWRYRFFHSGRPSTIYPWYKPWGYLR